MPLLDLVNEVVSDYTFRPVSRTANANGTGIDFGNSAVACAAILNVGTASGTNPTCDVKMQESTDNTTFTDISGATFTQATAANTREVIRFLTTKRYVRAAFTIGGTSTPTFLFGVDVFGQKKFMAGVGVSQSGYSRSPGT